jgi:hypothetical protein
MSSSRSVLELIDAFFFQLPSGEDRSGFWIFRMPEYFGPHHGTTVQAPDGTLTALTFNFLKAEILTQGRIDISTWNSTQFLRAVEISPDHLISEHHDYFYVFDTEQEARQASYKALFLIEEATNEPQFLEIQRHRTQGWAFRLTKQQHAALEAFRYQDRFIKTIRFDEKCFYEEFVRSVTKAPVHDGVGEYKGDEATQGSDEVEPDLILRHQKKLPWTINAAGVFHQREKVYPHYPEDYLEKKPYFSKPQSSTLIGEGIQPVPFGFNRLGAGVSFDRNDAMVSRYLVHDMGTVARPWNFASRNAARARHTYLAFKYPGKLTRLCIFLRAKHHRKPHKLLFETLEEFKRDRRGKKEYNEVLARFSWNPLSSCIMVFADTLEARAIGQLYAQNMEKAVRKRAEVLGRYLPCDYHVPIVFYLPGSPKNLTAYPLKQKILDRQLADQALLENFDKALQTGQFAFLGLISSPDLLRSQRHNNVLLLNYVLGRGHYFLLKYCLERMSPPAPLSDWLLNLSESIPMKSAQAFLIATLFQNEGHRFITLRRENVLNPQAVPQAVNIAFNYHLSFGNLKAVQTLLPIQTFQPKDIEAMVFNACASGYLNLVREMVNHFRSTQTPILLSSIRDSNMTSLLHMAASRGDYEMAQFLLETGSSPHATNSRGMTPLVYATSTGDLQLAQLLLDHGANPNVASRLFLSPYGQARLEKDEEMMALLRTQPGFILPPDFSRIDRATRRIMTAVPLSLCMFLGIGGHLMHMKKKTALSAACGVFLVFNCILALLHCGVNCAKRRQWNAYQNAISRSPHRRDSSTDPSEQPLLSP